MKLRNQNLTQQKTSEYIHPWYQYLNKPNPPTKEAVERARFIDKTYDWRGGDGSIRSGDQRTSQ